ncbi:MAG: hypothetical protein J7L12_05510 [Desulfurococcales archaeon]|nr:hypothetical protein [Desulfurococcales archaeon]
MHFLEGDCVELHDGSIWIVKGCHHPINNVIALPRLVNGRKVKRISKALGIVYRYYRHFITYVDFIGKYVPAIPRSLIRKHFSALRAQCPKDAGDIGQLCSELVDLLYSECGLKCGVTGSLLYGAYSKDSDIDLVCMDAGDSTYDCLLKLRKKGVLKKLSPASFVVEYIQVSEGLNFTDHLKSVLSRVTQGKYGSRRYTLRIISPERERLVLGPYIFEYYVSKVIAKIVSSDFRTPSVYAADILKPYIAVGEKAFIVSFRVRFTEIPENSILLISNALLALRRDGTIVISLDNPGTYVKILT